MKKQRKWQLLGLLIAVTLLGTGCVQYDSSTGQYSGVIYDYIGKPTSILLDWLAHFFGGSYGMAIIIVTLITRLFMMPSSISMTKNSMMSQARMKIAQPEIDEIQAEIRASNSPQEQAKLQQELMAVYKKYDINMMGSLTGCLPLLIQLPIISAVYAAIRSSENIKNSTFFGISLGQQSIILVVLVVIVYFVQGWLMQKQMEMPEPAEGESSAASQTMQATSKTMLWLNPVMLGWISYASAAGLAVYFLTGGIFALFQQLYTNHIVKPRIKALLEKEAANRPAVERRVRKTPQVQTTTDGKKRLVPTRIPQNNAQAGGRNAGKQNRK